MLDKINIFKQDKNKKNQKSYHEELFSILTEAEKLNEEWKISI